MKKLLPLLLALCLTLSACAAPAAVPLPGDSVTAVTVTYAGKTVTCTDPAQVRAMTDAARSHEAEWCAALVQRTLSGEAAQ